MRDEYRNSESFVAVDKGRGKATKEVSDAEQAEKFFMEVLGVWILLLIIFQKVPE